ncbi:MAG: hypothetical protein H6713_28075 [Myxococcales bacterium]|nr:hypothetical protein [Myxococcales bacterium]
MQAVLLAPSACSEQTLDISSRECLEGQAECGDGCVNPEVNVKHCGGCDQPCLMTQVCVAGVCVLNCGVGEEVCGLACVNPLTDADHCGGCDEACEPTALCVGGACAGECPPSTSECANTCIDTATSPGLPPK